MERLDNARILIYSHDSFGLGHLRRCRAIAHAIVDRYKGVSVLILSGSPIIGSFDFLPRVDFVRIPGVVKLTNGEYQSLGLHIDLDQTMAMRAAIIQQTAESFRPNLFLVDKEPLGLRGEVTRTLRMLKARGTTLVLGLRDIMDEPALLVREWKRKKVLPALEHLYDEIWVYGLARFADPLGGVACPASVRAKMVYTGYLRRSVPRRATSEPPVHREPYVLVTVGGGDDGMDLLDWVLAAYEHDPRLPLRAVIVTGPFMAAAEQRQFRARAERLRRIEMLTFDANLEALMERAAGVVSMAGYNTFCEILSLDKRAILVPRVRPRREQVMRAMRAAALGLAHTLDPEAPHDPSLMMAALRGLGQQPKPSQRGASSMLGGLGVITDLVAERVGMRVPRRERVAAQA
ncbi:MAG TPA: glycosyltransferase [Casimicrobiaceae bacterium]|jgi:predicted glycosyltransferase|nr:glycosyltransferase [Casimicrobiaceae bacterium]